MVPSKYSAWMQVMTDAVSLAEARRLAPENTNSRLRQLMQKPEKFRFDNIDRIFKANRFLLLPAWRTLVLSANASFQRRLVAAQFLCDRHDASGLAFLMDTVRTAKKQERREAVMVLYRAVCNDAPWMRRHARDPGALLNLFTRLNDDLIPMAARMCKDLQVFGAADKAIALWDKPISAWARHALLTYLMPREAKTRDRFKAIEAALRQNRLSEFERSQGLQCATAFLDAADAAADTDLVRRCLDLIQKRFPWKSKDLTRDDAGVSSEWEPIIVETGKRGSRRAVPLLERFLRSRLNAGYRGGALKALAGVLGADSLCYIDESLDELRLAPDVAAALGLAFAGSGDTRAIARLQKLASRTRDEFARRQITVALAAIGGPGARKAARKQLASAPPHDRQHLKAIADQTTLTQTCSRLAAIGLITPLSPEEIQEVQATEKREADDPAWSLLLLDHAHIRTVFDSESVEVPCRHDQLILEFAENSRGVFTPEIVLQKKGKAPNAAMLVQFVFHNRLYRFQARDFGDYYDIERVVASMNMALGDSGLREKFLSRDTGDQIADFIFGDPGVISEAAREFQWTLDEDFNRMAT